MSRKAGGFIILGIGIVMTFLLGGFLEGALELGAIYLYIEFFISATVATILFFILSYYFPSHKKFLWYIILILLLAIDLLEFWPYRGIFR
jgi:hypothetical protein